MKVLVIGSGGREHALVWKLVNSPSVDGVYCALGNPGIAELAQCVNISADDHEGLADFVRRHGIGLTVVGPEIPLVNGISDYFSSQGLALFGPTKAAAQLEGSKSFCKALLAKYEIPTAKYAVFTDAAEAKEYINQQGAPIVIKADGLAAGKGVVVAMDMEEALQAVDTMMGDKIFGEAGSRLVVEEFMTGEEASLLAFTDGITVIPMVAAQDHKRIFDGDRGPNTGGMGAYAPAPVLTPELLQQVRRDILQPVVDGLRQEGCLYQGCLYAGLMITADGPKVVEFNARFGDPETQVVLPLLDSDLAQIMLACVQGKLHEVSVQWHDKAAVCVVTAAGGYPGTYAKGDIISGIETAQNQGALVFHAGTADKEGVLVTNGGRVLGVTAVGDGLVSTVGKAYEAIKTISFTGMHYRSDIAKRVL